MTDDHTNFRNCGAYDFLRDLREEMRDGLAGIQNRLDQQNGRVRALEIHAAEIRGRAILISSVSAIIATAIVTGIVRWVIP